MVPAEEEEGLRVLDLVAHEEAHRLDALLGAVHVVAQEDVVAVRGEVAHLEEPQQVVVLPVRVAWVGGCVWRADNVSTTTRDKSPSHATTIQASQSGCRCRDAPHTLTGQATSRSIGCCKNVCVQCVVWGERGGDVSKNIACPDPRTNLARSTI